jgi:hypothetical protein
VGAKAQLLKRLKSFTLLLLIALLRIVVNALLSIVVTGLQHSSEC